MSTKIRIEPRGGTANQLLQYFFAANVQRQVADLEISGYNSPDWGLPSNDSHLEKGPKKLTIKGSRISSSDVVRILQKYRITNLVLSGLPFRLSNYAPPEYYKEIIKTESRSPKIYGEKHVVFHIRGADILGSAHRDYFPVPLSYIDSVLKNTDSSPVFLGQLENSYYTDKLRSAYPSAIFSPLRSPVEDFETLRRSHEVAISISSFAWVAAWLSDAQKIHLPVAGMLNPEQRPDIDLLPLDDPRYAFYDFKLHRWKATPDDMKMLWEPREHAILSVDALKKRKRIALMRTSLATQWARLRLQTEAYRLRA